MTNKTKKLLILVCAVVVGGFISGFVFQLFVFPSILANSYFSQFQFIKNFKEGKIIINTKEEVIVSQETALEKAITKVEKSVILIQTETQQGKISGSGVIATSDGLIITLSELAAAGAKISVIYEGEALKPEIVKRDAKNNLVLLKIPKTNLKSPGFADSESIKLGQRVFLLGINPKDQTFVANEGMVKSLNENIIKTNIFEISSLWGSPLFNIEGNLVGLNLVDSSGKISAIPIQKIKSFTGF